MTAISAQAGFLRAITIMFMPLKFIPSLVQLILAVLNVYNNPLSIITDSQAVIAALSDPVSTFLRALTFFPIDLWVDIEALFWPDHTKNSAYPGVVWTLRSFSWIILGYAGVNFLMILSASIYESIVNKSDTSIVSKTLTKVFTSLFALIPPMTYFFQVNDYEPYF